ncbi:hypothetical protein K7X08_016372 [Anisodus acutangulus]|uniref:Uncharacterized protein n=1 Tax=Anisodus acutangulus TaxID=402998 RepID=A0A9Q1LGD4_9SOLA|nr:hypothetical protein K7X08_016372 [Anisodus acutangulus]
MKGRCFVNEGTLCDEEGSERLSGMKHSCCRVAAKSKAGAELMGKYGINVPKGVAVTSRGEVKKQFKKYYLTKMRYISTFFFWVTQVVVKAQVLAGGRGLGTFKNEFKGGVYIVKADQAEDIAAQGKVVSKVYLCEKMSLVNEMYFSIILDRATAGPLIIACSKGGTSIEDLAEKFPHMIIKVPIDVFRRITDEDAAKMVDGLTPKVADRSDSIEQVKKLNFDDNAAYRQKEIFSVIHHKRIPVAAAKADLNYIGLDGEIGCMVNGAGLAMATMDIIKLHRGTPANFLDVGGNATEGKSMSDFFVVEAFKILTSDEKVKAILVNIFGGIMKCDVIASGIVNAAKQVQLKVPVVVRLEGTNVDQGKRILKESGMTLITAEDLDDAAEKAVKAAAS